jgi:hypothetical protein
LFNNDLAVGKGGIGADTFIGGSLEGSAVSSVTLATLAKHWDNRTGNIRGK